MSREEDSGRRSERRLSSSRRPARERHSPLVQVWRWQIPETNRQIPLNWALAVGDAVMNGITETSRRLSGSGLLPLSLHGPDDPRGKKWRHGHAFVLSEDCDNDGIVDHITVSASVGLDPRALRLLAATDRISLSNGVRTELVTERVVPLRELPADLRGPARSWKSRTAYVPPKGRRRLENVVRLLEHEIRKRGLDAGLVQPPKRIDFLVHAGETLSADAFHIIKDDGGCPPEGAQPCFFDLTFERPVSGPLAFGWSSHRGLGMFVPAD